MKKPSSELFESSSIQSSDERIEASQFLLSFLWSAQIGKGLTCTNAT